MSAIELNRSWPVQCECGHIFQEKYAFMTPNDNGEVGFCWCGWCRTKRMVRATDKELLKAYADALERIVPPEVSSDDAKAELLDAVRRIEAICEDLERFGE